jgi:hypothetical protein
MLLYCTVLQCTVLLTCASVSVSVSVPHSCVRVMGCAVPFTASLCASSTFIDHTGISCRCRCLGSVLYVYVYGYGYVYALYGMGMGMGWYGME